MTDDSGAAITSVAFPDTGVGGTVRVLLHLSNTGDTSSGTISVSASGDFMVDAATTSCAPLDPGGTCDIGIAFQPAVDGARTGTLVAAGDPGGTVAITLSGTGLVGALQLVPSIYNFGPVNVGTTATTTFQITNTSTAVMPLDAIEINGAGLAQSSTTCGATLPTSASCDVVVTFAPASLGTAAGTLTVISGATPYAASLSGTGTREVTVVTAGTGTGTVTSSPAGINCGAACAVPFAGDVQLIAAPASGSVVASWSASGCSGATCNITATPVAQQVTVTFTYTGITLSPATLDWGLTDASGSGVVHTFQLTNAGTAAVAIDGMFATQSFQVAGSTCGATLAAGASCSIDVRFAPTTTGPATGELEISVNSILYHSQLSGSGGLPVAVTVQGSGEVDSNPAGIVCGATCSALFGQAVTLSAYPTPGYGLESWSDPSCSGPTCVVAPGASVTATFAILPTTPFTVQFAGDALGSVAILDVTDREQVVTIGMCDATCTVNIPIGDIIAISAATPSTYGGLSGACSDGAGQECSFTAAVSETETVTFTHVAPERWTALTLDLSRVVGAAFDDTGGLVVVQTDAITKYSATGQVLWTSALASDGFLGAAGGSFYTTDSGTLRQFDGSGNVTASRPFTGTLQFLGPSGHIFGVDSSTGLMTEWDAAGQLVRTLSFGPVLGIDSSSTFYGLTRSTSGMTTYSAPRWQFDGTPLAPFPEVAPPTSSAADASLIVGYDHIVGYNGVLESHSPGDVLEATTDGGSSIAVAGPDEVAYWWPLSATIPYGVVVEWHTFSTATTYDLERPAYFESYELRCSECGPQIIAEDITIAGGPHGEIALIGWFEGLTYASPSRWTVIETFYP